MACSDDSRPPRVDVGDHPAVEGFRVRVVALLAANLDRLNRIANEVIALLVADGKRAPVQRLRLASFWSW
jgi:hypothetical protein